MSATTLHVERAGALPALAALRPRQWTKNALLLAGLLFAGKAGDATRWVEALVAVAAYSAVASASYLVNDVHDVDADRRHPVKRLRPVASGALSRAHALALAGLLACAGLTLAGWLGIESLALIVGFLALQTAYTLALKSVAVVELLALAGCFVLRAAAGAAAVDVRISGWLLACTALLALFLGAAKRRGELALVRVGATPGRRVLAHYDRLLLDVAVVACAVAAGAAYVLYATVGRDAKEMLVTVPFVAFGLARYLVLVRRRGLGEEPEEVVTRDVPILAAVALWAVSAAAVVALS
jgi:4-hydroxybenzoate polyprenyltransferase